MYIAARRSERIKFCMISRRRFDITEAFSSEVEGDVLAFVGIRNRLRYDEMDATLVVLYSCSSEVAQSPTVAGRRATR